MALVNAMALTMVLGVASVSGRLRARHSPVLSAVTAAPAVIRSGAALCERVAKPLGTLRALVADQAAVSVDAQRASLLGYRLPQPGDLSVHAVASPAAFLGRARRIVRASQRWNRGGRHE